MGLTDTWITVGGVKCPCRLTKTTIVATVEDGVRRDKWGRTSPGSGAATWRSNLTSPYHTTYRRLSVSGNIYPRGGNQPRDIDLLIVETWPECSEDVWAWLQAAAQRASERAQADRERDAAEDRQRVRDRTRAAIEAALLDAARSGNERALLTVADAYRKLTEGA